MAHSGGLPIPRKTAMYTGEYEERSGRPKRKLKLPGHLNDFILGDFREAMSLEAKSTSSRHTEILEAEREITIAEIERRCKKSVSMLAAGASSGALQRIDSRLGKSLQELKSVTDRLITAEENRPFKDDVRLFGTMKRQVEDHQDRIAEQIETQSHHTRSERESYVTVDEVHSTGSASNKRCEQWQKTSATHSLVGKNNSDADSEKSNRTHVSSDRAIKKAIKAEVADLRVKQEKEVYQSERIIREAERQLRLQREENAAERERLAKELWATQQDNVSMQQESQTEYPEQKRQLEGEASTLVRPRLGTQRYQRIETPPHEFSTPKPRKEDDMRSFFQGMAKPKLPKFEGERGLYRQWFEQFNIFVNEAKVPVKFKMVMLKNSLGGTPLDLVKNLGYTEAQYDIALEKLEIRYGGDRRALRQCTDDIVSAQPVKEGDLTELADFANKLYDTVAKLRDTGRGNELRGTSTIYTVVLQKIPNRLLFQYQNEKAEELDEGLGTFTKWLNRQVAIRIEMSELKESILKRPADKQNKMSNAKVKDNGKFKSRSHASGAESDKKDKRPFTQKKQQTHESTASAAQDSNSVPQLCPLCNEKHPVAKCKIWTDGKVSDRWKIAKEKGLCYRCLQRTHRGAQCTMYKKCGLDDCVRTHHQSLHGSNPPTTNTSKEIDKPHNAFGIGSDGTIQTTKVALRVLPVYVTDSKGCKRKIYAFLDDGSDSSYLRTDMARSLGLTVERNDLTLSTLVNENTQVPSGFVTLSVSSLDGSVQNKLGVRVLEKMCDGLSAPNWHSLKENWTHLRGINFPKVAGEKKVDLLIGSDHPELTLSLEERVGNAGEPVARKTPLGWTCVGALNPPREMPTMCFLSTSTDTHQVLRLEESIRRLWDMDVVHELTATHTPQEQAAVKKVSDSIIYTGERYRVKIPWNEDRPELPDNKQSAKRRLENLEKSLLRKPEVAAKYRETFQNNIDKGYIKRITEEEENTPGWYLPHFAVVREDRSTTKVRVVFDGAATHAGKSLNDEMMTGPRLQLDIVDILIQFRQGLVALVGDIKEMFSQVELEAEDTKYHRILWRDLDTSKPIEVYESVRLPFGDRASPFLAQFVIKKHAEEHAAEFPMAATSCLNRMYVDDSLNSEDSVDEVVALWRQLAELLKKGGFIIRKWCSNSPEVMAHIPMEDRAAGALEIEDSEMLNVKTLGLRWEPNEDVLGFSHSEGSLEMVTKRTVLSLTAKLFDPLQLLAPFIIRARIILQSAWIEGLQWDDPFPPELVKPIELWMEELPGVADFQVPRCCKKDVPTETSLHTFSDASGQAYGAVCYLRSVYSDGAVTVRIIVAKARVTPLKAVSIPRLELMGAILGLRLALKVKELLPVTEMVFWTDSTDVLYWIRGQSRKYKPFVAHRVSEIQSSTSPAQWRHVPGKVNPADLASRGAKLAEIAGDSLWTTGPEFLHGNEDSWPPHLPGRDKELSEEAKLEHPKSTGPVDQPCIDDQAALTCHAARPDKESHTPLIDMERFSRWIRLVRSMAWVLRVTKLRTETPEVLSAEETQASEEYLIREVQQQHFGDVIQNLRAGKVSHCGNLKPLSPFLDSEGLLRVGGRLENSKLPFEAKHPLILPSDSHMSILLIRRYHGELGRHTRGVNATLSDVRQKYWIVRGRERVKKVLNACVTCRKLKRQPLQQIMAPLPAHRVTVPLRAFARVGVDYGGPYIVKISRNKTDKRWLCLFTCTTSRAVHLEIAYSLSTAGFLNAFSRMVARRGRPELVVSDNSTNFVGAERELRELVESMDVNKLISDAANRGIAWRFNPPWGSHHGGMFESMIKSAKKALRAILGEARLTDEELLTAVVEVEGLLNSRPLAYCSSDVADEHVLTPNHFLVGQAGGQLAPRILEEEAANPRARWRFIQELVTNVWKRWNSEFLSQLQSRGKWLSEKPDIQVGDVVLVADSTNPKGRWPLGEVKEQLESSDGHVRSVIVTCGLKDIIRPISKLVKLDINSKESEYRGSGNEPRGGECSGGDA